MALVGENNAGKTAILRALNSVFNYEYEKEFFLNYVIGFSLNVFLRYLKSMLRLFNVDSVL